MRFLLSLIVVVSPFLWVPTADAQWRSERPYRGLFAGGVGETEQSLTASASLGTGWDDNLVADALGRTRALAPSDVTREFRGGVYTGSAALSYSLSRTAVALGATAGTTARYYPSLEDRIIRREYGSVGASANLGAGFSTQASAMYQPYSLRSLMPSLFESRLGDPAIVDEDFPSSLEHFLGYSAGVGFTRPLTPRQTFSATYGYNGREPVRGRGRFDRHSVGANLNYQVGRNLGLQFGYGYSEALYDDDRRFASHTINANVNYNRALSFSRRTTLSFGTGSGASRRSRNDSLRFHATGSASLNHEIGRTWNASASYQRGLRFLESWPEPVFTDSAMASVGGLVTNRVQAYLSARALRGQGYSSADRSRMVSYGATAGASVAVTRYVNTGVTYSYYLHDFSDRVTLAAGFPDQLDRRSIRVFVSVWAPLFQTTRRP